MNSVNYIGCCGAYCKTCQALIDKSCRGCKLGHDTGKRDIEKAKCAIKVCSMTKNYQICGDCLNYLSCEIIQGFYNKMDISIKNTSKQ